MLLKFKLSQTTIYLLLFGVLLRFDASEQQAVDPSRTLVCANSFNSENRIDEQVRCRTLDSKTTVDLECSLTKSYKLNAFKHTRANVIRSRLSISPPRLDLNETVFLWDHVSIPSKMNLPFRGVKIHTFVGSFSHLERELLFRAGDKNEGDSDSSGNFSMELSLGLFNDSYSEVVLYNIKHDTLYRLCAQVNESKLFNHNATAI